MQGGRLDPFVGILRRNDLAAGGVQRQPCLGGKAGSRHGGQLAHRRDDGGRRRSGAGGRRYALGRTQGRRQGRSEEHTSELQSLMRISYAVFCLKKKKKSN